MLGFLPLSTRGARPHHGAMLFEPVDAGSCFCEALFSTSRRNLARCSARAHFRAPSASAESACWYWQNFYISTFILAVHTLCKRRGKSVSDGFSRASLCVFAVNPPSSAAAVAPAFLCGPCISQHVVLGRISLWFLKHTGSAVRSNTTFSYFFIAQMAK